MSSIDPPSPGARFRAALAKERPLQIAGTINAYCALLAEREGFQALYLSGAGVANASRGIPDLGMTTLDDVLTDVRRITTATKLPLLVDIDTGWDDGARTVREMIAAGAAAVHMEDQIEAKRCGHRPGKRLVPTDEMLARIKEAVRGRTDPNFVIIARTDAVSVEGLDAAIDRACRYRDTRREYDLRRGVHGTRALRGIRPCREGARCWRTLPNSARRRSSLWSNSAAQAWRWCSIRFRHFAR
jgi:methylisocitrate lyase